MALKNFMAPSGQMFLDEDIRLWIELERNGTIAWSDSDVKFNSGFLSRVYFRGRSDLTDNPALLRQVAFPLKKFVDELPLTHGPQKCLIGVPTAGTPLAQAISDISLHEQDDPPFCFRLMRSVLKDHGKDNLWVAPPELRKHSYITVENVVSTAKAMLGSFTRLEQDGYPTKQMHHLVFASWELGGSGKLADLGYTVDTLYYLPDVIAAFVHVGHWREERYVEMVRRIREWNATH